MIHSGVYSYNIVWNSLSVTCDRSVVSFTNKTDHHWTTVEGGIKHHKSNQIMLDLNSVAQH